jgi:hypothetical protein
MVAVAWRIVIHRSDVRAAVGRNNQHHAWMHDFAGTAQEKCRPVWRPGGIFFFFMISTSCKRAPQLFATVPCKS